MQTLNNLENTTNLECVQLVESSEKIELLKDSKNDKALLIDNRKILINHDFNMRSRLDYDTNELKESIISIGKVITPILIKKLNKTEKELNPNFDYKLVHGYRRFTAINELINDGFFPIDYKISSQLHEGDRSGSDELFYHYTLNSGKALRSMDIARLIWTAKEMYNKSFSEIEKKITSLKGQQIKNYYNSYLAYNSEQIIQLAYDNNLLTMTDLINLMIKNKNDIDLVVEIYEQGIIDSFIESEPYKNNPSQFETALSMLEFIISNTASNLESKKVFTSEDIQNSDNILKDIEQSAGKDGNTKLDKNAGKPPTISMILKDSKLIKKNKQNLLTFFGEQIHNLSSKLEKYYQVFGGDSLQEIQRLEAFTKLINELYLTDKPIDIKQASK
jgi:hypothetical protein